MKAKYVNEFMYEKGKKYCSQLKAKHIEWMKTNDLYNCSQRHKLLWIMIPLMIIFCSLL